MNKLENLKDNQLLRPKTTREWFLVYLFSDPDFIVEHTKIMNAMKSAFGDPQYGVLLLMAGTLPITERLRSAGALDIVDRIEALAAKFHATIPTVELGLTYTDIHPKYSLKRLPRTELDGDTVIIRVSATTRLEDIKAIYGEVQELQKQLKGHTRRSRSKVHPDLVYAIYKQRLHRATFKQIYAMYEVNQLPMYDGPASITGEEELARMYRKYKPAI